MARKGIAGKICVALLVAVPGVALSAQPVSLPSATQVAGAINSSILGSLTAASSQSLSFGVLVRPPNPPGAGTVTVSTAGVASLTGTGALLSASAATQARFTITGEGGATISVSVPGSVTLASGSNQLVVTLASDLAGGSTTQTLGGTAGSDGSLVVNVGGSFPLSNTTSRGVYTGSFSVSASYN